jgi:hypothetical protein
MPTLAQIDVAPLGAFVPWRPLSIIEVPAIEPEGSVTTRTEAIRVATRPLGPPDRVPPQRLLTALGSDDEDSESSRPRSSFVANWLSQLSRVARRSRGQTPGTLPADPLELIGRTNPHWAGNLNVFVGDRAVERHLAKALRIYPGRVNMAMFVVGSGKDSYAFSLAGNAAGWDADLFDMMRGESHAIEVRDEERVRQNEWIPVQSQTLMMLKLVPPQGSVRGTIEVHVEQQSSGREALVEFSLDRDAAGPGCYVV